MQYLFISFVFISSLFNNPQKFLPESDEKPITHQFYSLSYNEENEQANWVYYKLTGEMLSGDAKRSSNFRNDPLVSTKSASTKDYTKSGYDRGHLCPAADMKFDDKAMYESFYMSNVSPQVPEFNRGIWKELETQVRSWAVEKDSIYVVTGPVFDDSNIAIGKNQVRVPSSFYKILYDPGQEKMIAFLFPNEASELPFENFTSTVNFLEEITGTDFFSQLPDETEEQLESEIVLAGWFASYEEPAPADGKSPNVLLIFLLVIVGIVVISFVFRKRK